MEEEYRFEKSASVTAVRGGSTSKSGDSDSEDEEQSDDKPAINGHNKEAGVKENGEKGKEDGDQEEHANVIEKPEHSVLPEEVKGGTETGHPNSEGKISTQKYSHIQNKRLCERWLDNLFMVLYEDLRVYTIWRSDLARYGQQKRPYRKSATELEFLGELAQRLHHHAEAEEAFQSRLQIRFSARALRGVLQTQEKNKDNRGALNSIIRLTAWQYRWYSEFSPAILYSIRKLIAEDGAVKVRSIVQATSFPQSVLDLTHNYAQLCAAFRSSGSDG